MVFKALGRDESEFDLRVATECDEDGTSPSKAVEIARHYGFAGSYQDFFTTLGDIRKILTRELFPIAFLKLSPVWGTPPHAVVVVEIIESNIQVLDPERGDLSIPIDEFTTAWGKTNYQIIVVQP